MMRKLLTLVAMATMTMNGTAQEAAEKYSVATNSFWSNWFVQTNVTWGSFYVGGSDRLLSSPFRGFPLGAEPWKDGGHPTALGASLALGKWFTPGIGLRLKASGLWVGKAFSKQAQKYGTLNGQALLNLSNMLCGYNERRVWNVVPYIGFGPARAFEANRNTLAWSAGVMNTFRLGKVVALNLEVGYVNYGKDFLNSGIAGGLNAHQRDHQLTVEVGATFNLTRGWKRTPDMDAVRALTEGEIDALNAQLADAEAENDRLRQELNRKPKAQETAPDVQTVTKVVMAPVSVFFQRGKAVIADRRVLQNVAELVRTIKENAAKENGAKEGAVKVVVTGYADSKTGSADYNRALSQRRADAVADELVAMGVSREQIETVAAGGVEALNPADYNRRAVVELK